MYMYNIRKKKHFFRHTLYTCSRANRTNIVVLIKGHHILGRLVPTNASFDHGLTRKAGGGGGGRRGVIGPLPLT